MPVLQESEAPERSAGRYVPAQAVQMATSYRRLREDTDLKCEIAAKYARGVGYLASACRV